MLVHLVHLPVAGVHRLPGAAICELGSALRSAGVSVQLTIAPAALTAADMPELVEKLRQDWQQAPPTLVHTFGARATRAAVLAGCPVPLIATFDEAPAERAVELALASQAACVLPLSNSERHTYRRSGVTSLWGGPFPLNVGEKAVSHWADPQGWVVTDAIGLELSELLASMHYWKGQLVLLARFSPTDRRAIAEQARRLGVHQRVLLRPAPAGTARNAVWAGAALFYAGSHIRHGATLLEAAAHGVPGAAAAESRAAEFINADTTGVLLPKQTPRALGRAIAKTLSDGFTVQALGLTAQVAARAGHRPEIAGQRLLGLYQQLLENQPASPRPQPATTSQKEAGLVARDELALAHMPLARQLAGWYTGRGQSRDDLVQVAALGLLQAAERYDSEQGHEFHSFAVPTILGEIRKHFRNHAWALHVARGLQESTMQVKAAVDRLQQSSGRTPSVAELAAELGTTQAEVRRAMQAQQEASTSRSLDQPVAEGTPVGALIGDYDPDLELAEMRDDVRAALAHMPHREQQIVLLRFFGERTQDEIGRTLGLSQVHVSRILSKSLAAIREHVLADAPLPAAWGAVDTRSAQQAARRAS